MGGINSGRRPIMFADERNRPLMEEAATLSVFALSRDGILEDGRSGIYRWDTSSFYYWTEGNTITLHYRTGKQEVTQSINIGRIPLYWNNSTWKPCFICPACERSAYKLYVAFGQTHYRCRVCYNIAYELQTMHYGGLCYRYMSIHKRVENRRNRSAKKRKVYQRHTKGIPV